MVINGEEHPNVDQSIPVARGLEAFSKQRNGRLVNYREDELDLAHYRRSKESAAGMNQLWVSQGCPTGLLLIPAQLGNKHAGKSVLRAREVMRGSEFPLDPYDVLMILYTQEHCLQSNKDLTILFPGGEFSLGGEFEYSLFIRFLAGKWEFSSCEINNPAADWGSASGFVL
jgi:hypothetical protein